MASWTSSLGIPQQQLTLLGPISDLPNKKLCVRAQQCVVFTKPCGRVGTVGSEGQSVLPFRELDGRLPSVEQGPQFEQGFLVPEI